MSSIKNAMYTAGYGFILVGLGVVIGRYLTLLEFENTIVRMRIQHVEKEALDGGLSSQEDNKESS